MPQQHLPRARDSQSGYLAEDTIAAIASAVGGAIAVIRISGPEAFTALERLGGSTQVEPRKLVRAALRSPRGEPLDDALYAKFVRPDSFTGEDVVEFHVHGGGFIATRLMETLSELGVRQALPGEFSFRAVRNGKMSLSQAQAIADLIAASNEGAVSLALEKLSGTQNKLIGEIAEKLRKVATLGEAGIDFADQDIDEVSLPNLKKQLATLISALDRLQQSYDRGIRLQEGVKVAFVGLPNAGKSSFFNALLGEDRSIVSEQAGTTRDVVREKIVLRGKTSTITLRLEDTAGLRSATDHVEKMGIERTQKAAREADLLLFVLDPTQSPDAAREQWAAIGSPSSRSIGILTKIDLAGPDQLQQILESCQAFGIQSWVQTSAVTGQGIREAVEAITSYCERWVHREKGELLLTRLDHLRAVTDTLAHLNRALDASEVDLFASDIRQALHSLGPLIGETVPDDILGRIFSEFCIGK